MFNVIASLPNYSTIAVEIRKKYSVLLIRKIMLELNGNVNNRITDYINKEIRNHLPDFPKSEEKHKEKFVTELVQLLNIFITIPKVRREQDQVVYDGIVKEWADTVRDFILAIEKHYTVGETFRPDMVQFLTECQDEITMIIANEFFNRFLPDRKDLNPLENFTI